MSYTDAAATLPFRLATAGLVGLAAGLEREWSGHASGPAGRFAGLRTFLLLGLVGGIAGLLLDGGHELLAALLVGGTAALVVAAYVVAVHRDNADLDGTTETAAIVIVALGVLAGIGQPLLAAGTGAIVVLALREKARLHGLVHHIAVEELAAALEYAVLALVVLPLLPTGPYGGVLDVQPRTIWALVLLFSGLNFAGYVARRVLGAGRGYGVTGALGGLVSSTAVTLQFARTSRAQPQYQTALAAGVVGACTVLIPRVLVITALFDLGVTLRLAEILLFPAVVGVLVMLVYLRHDGADTGTSAGSSAATHANGSPLGLWNSVRMAVLFQLAISAIALVQQRWGTSGLYTTAVALGITDVDALTVSTSRSGGPALVSAVAITIGILANTATKMVLATALGGGEFRRRAAAGLFALASASALGAWLVYTFV